MSRCTIESTCVLMLKIVTDERERDASHDTSLLSATTNCNSFDNLIYTDSNFKHSCLLVSCVAPTCTTDYSSFLPSSFFFANNEQVIINA